jgi:hypothetical protein
MNMNFQLKTVLFLVTLMQGCSSTHNIEDTGTSNSIMSVNVYYNSLREDDAKALQNKLVDKGYLVRVEKNKPLSRKYSSYIYVSKQDAKSAVMLNSIVKNLLNHNLNTNFFKDKEKSGIAKIILTNTEAKNTPIKNTKKTYIPQLWSHHKQLNILPEQCAVKGIEILKSLGFSSVVKNGTYVYGNFELNRATIKCVGVDKHTFVYTAVAGESVKQVEQLRNKISWKL